MAAPLTVISENSVAKVRDEGEFDTFFRENPAAQVVQSPYFMPREGSHSKLTLVFEGSLTIVQVLYLPRLHIWGETNQVVSAQSA